MKDYLDEKIKSKVDIEYSFEDIVNKIDIESGQKYPKKKSGLSFLIPSFAIALILIISFGFIDGFKNNNSEISHIGNNGNSNNNSGNLGLSSEPINMVPSSSEIPEENSSDLPIYSSTSSNRPSFEEPGASKPSSEDNFYVSSIPQEIMINEVTYIMKTDRDNEPKLDTLIGHLINEDDIVQYQKDFALLTPFVVDGIYDYYYNNRVEVYTIVGKDVKESFAIKGSFGIEVFTSEN